VQLNTNSPGLLIAKVHDYQVIVLGNSRNMGQVGVKSQRMRLWSACTGTFSRQGIQRSYIRIKGQIRPSLEFQAIRPLGQLVDLRLVEVVEASNRGVDHGLAVAVANFSKDHRQADDEAKHHEDHPGEDGAKAPTAS
jgi:hypothetical protein